jgi:hypothetical protein
MKRTTWQSTRLASLFALCLLVAACDSDDGGVVIEGINAEEGAGDGDGDGNADGDGNGDGESSGGDSELNPNLETISVALDSATTVPPANVDGATGQGSFSVDTETGAIGGSVTVSGTSGQPSAAHIHSGAAGVAGPIVVNLTGNDDGTVWTVPDGEALDADGIALFEAGELYVNVHTEENPAGELRSQLVEAGTTAPSPGTVTISLTNTAEFQPMTPPVVVLHNAPSADNGIRIFEVGQPAIDQLISIAEDGDFQPMVDLAAVQQQQGAASASAVAFADPNNPGPLQPGATASVTLDVETADQVLTILSMVVCTNDGFSGVDSRSLPDQGSETFTAPIYDAGSETNVLSLNYWVAPCSADGTSENLGDDENGSITAHPGQSGSENPNFDFAAGTEYLEVTVTRN